jgi:DeoR family glycerol-3-phosphate regulon repressor
LSTAAADPRETARLRHGAVRRALAETGEVRVAALAAAFGVTEETVRRDLKALEREGALRRVHGGAVPALRGGHASLAERRAAEAPAKAAIARAALPLLDGVRHLFLGEGTMSLALAAALVGRQPALRACTNMPEVAEALLVGGHEVELAGGTLHPAHRFLHGPDTLDWLRRRRFDMAVTGTSGVDPVLGFLDHEEFSAALRRLVAAQADRTVVLATQRAFGALAPIVTFGLGVAHALVTDRMPAAAWQDALTAAECALVVAV